MFCANCVNIQQLGQTDFMAGLAANNRPVIGVPPR